MAIPNKDIKIGSYVLINTGEALFGKKAKIVEKNVDGWDCVIELYDSRGNLRELSYMYDELLIFEMTLDERINAL